MLLNLAQEVRLLVVFHLLFLVVLVLYQLLGHHFAAFFPHVLLFGFLFAAGGVRGCEVGQVLRVNLVLTRELLLLEVLEPLLVLVKRVVEDVWGQLSLLGQIGSRY